MRFRIAIVAVFLGGACAGEGPRVPDPRRPFIGIAVRDTVGGWCAELPTDSVPGPSRGSIASLVFAGDSARTTARVRVRARRSIDCPTAFPQPRWTSYTAYDLELIEAHDPLPYLAVIVGSAAPWTRAEGGALRGDIDADGVLEEIRRCAADEGEHFTIWTLPAAGAPTRRWHEYFDWGANVDRTCAAGDDGR